MFSLQFHHVCNIDSGVLNIAWMCQSNQRSRASSLFNSRAMVVWFESKLQLIMAPGGQSRQTTFVPSGTTPGCCFVGGSTIELWDCVFALLNFAELVVLKQQVKIPSSILDHLQFHRVPRRGLHFTVPH